MARLRLFWQFFLSHWSTQEGLEFTPRLQLARLPSGLVERLAKKLELFR